ncbi:amino acid permease [Actinoplanes sp. SE50]|uniref:APC family permease n=1 Tax=unclassified Actinoplanes TaxID=2626549 RepID=UPI00023ED217|nr:MULTISPECIES: APC family permease [unclassified Actinoplanes]AEV83880.1 Putrescine importer [Actinoplanes sp. SE50/110]ATO81976.1 amino acid permease [Actinoplanes sp. SE50]SLL99384.1 amino acid permease [Actinoplanes sp. SE50/110]
MAETGLTEQNSRKLGTWSVFVIAVSAMTPLTVVAGALPLGYGEVKEKGIPVAYVLVAVVLAIFTVGLTAMARHVPNSGAFYAYAAKGLTRPAGVGTAFIALLAYNAMQIGLYGAFGVAAHNAAAIFGLKMSWIVWALLGWAVVSVLGLRQIDFNARILTVLVGAEVLIVLTLDAVMVGHPDGGSVAFDTVNPGLIASAGGVSLLVGAVAGMVGFESPLVYAAEARDPRRTVARAIFMTLGVAAILYGGSAWAMSVVAGPDKIIDVAARYLNDLFFVLPGPYLPTAVIDLARVFFATSLFAAMLAFHHTVARYALTVAREGVLPPALARTRDDVPVAASIAQSGLAFIVLVIFAALVLNPTSDLFFLGTVSGGLGVLALMTIASIAVVRFFRRDTHGETTWRRSAAPWIAAVFLVLMLLLSVAFFGELLDSDNLVKVWLPPIAFLGVYLLGVWWGRRLRRERPAVYAAIGTGLPPEADRPGLVVPPQRLNGVAAAAKPEAAARLEIADAAPATVGLGATPGPATPNPATTVTPDVTSQPEAAGKSPTAEPDVVGRSAAVGTPASGLEPDAAGRTMAAGMPVTGAKPGVTTRTEALGEAAAGAPADVVARTEALGEAAAGAPADVVARTEAVRGAAGDPVEISAGEADGGPADVVAGEAAGWRTERARPAGTDGGGVTKPTVGGSEPEEGGNPPVS